MTTSTIWIHCHTDRPLAPHSLHTMLVKKKKGRFENCSSSSSSSVAQQISVLCLHHSYNEKQDVNSQEEEEEEEEEEERREVKMMMEVSSKRRSAARSVVAGSVWESRMKMDQVKGGIKVFNGEEENFEENNILIKESLDQNQSDVGVGVLGVVRERRKTWKCEPVEMIGGRNSVLLRKIRSEEEEEEDDDNDKSCEEFYDSSSKEVNRSIDGIEKKSPILKNKSSSSSSRSRSLKEFDKIRSRSDSGGDVVVKEEIDIMSNKLLKKIDVKEVKLHEQRSKNGLILKEKLNQIQKTPVPTSVNNNKNQQSLAVVNHSSDLRKPPPPPPPEELERRFSPISEELVDLIMWRDMEKSALVFGIGLLVILLSSFTKDINFSLISLVSYMGLLYLAAIFLYRTLLCRGGIDFNDSINTVGEEEAILLVKLVLPYLNKFLLKLRLLFSGDPATTIKVAALLLVLARYGSIITLWRMAKLGFFGVFTLPKAYSWYSTQLIRDRNNAFQSLMDTVNTFLFKS